MVSRRLATDTGGVQVAPQKQAPLNRPALDRATSRVRFGVERSM